MLAKWTGWNVINVRWGKKGVASRGSVNFREFKILVQLSISLHSYVNDVLFYCRKKIGHLEYFCVITLNSVHLRKSMKRGRCGMSVWMEWRPIQGVFPLWSQCSRTGSGSTMIQQHLLKTNEWILLNVYWFYKFISAWNTAMSVSLCKCRRHHFRMDRSTQHNLFQLSQMHHGSFQVPGGVEASDGLLVFTPSWRVFVLAGSASTPDGALHVGGDHIAQRLSNQRVLRCGHRHSYCKTGNSERHHKPALNRGVYSVLQAYN